MPNIICPGKASNRWEEVKGRNSKSLVEAPTKRIRMKCELCGRKVLSSISKHDEFIIHTIPPHKVKHWWKKGKKL